MRTEAAYIQNIIPNNYKIEMQAPTRSNKQQTAIRVDEIEVKLKAKRNKWQPKKRPNLSTWSNLILLDIAKI